MDSFLAINPQSNRIFFPTVLLMIASSSIVVCQRTGATEEVVSVGKDGKLVRKLGGKTNKFRYDDGGLISCMSSVFWIKRSRNEEDPCREKYVRDFIWQHIQNKKRGYIRITYVAVDSGTREHFFIEPNEKGIWAVSCWSEGYSALPPGRRHIYPKRILFAEKLNWESGKDWSIKFKDKDGVNFLNMPEMLREN